MQRAPSCALLGEVQDPEEIVLNDGFAGQVVVAQVHFAPAPQAQVSAPYRQTPAGTLPQRSPVSGSAGGQVPQCHW